MKKSIYIIVALLTVPSLVLAQTPETERPLDRQVDVSRDYTPDVERAAKLPISPDMTDTVALRPDFEYTLAPIAWPVTFQVDPINPVRIETYQFNPLEPFYLKAGVGVPFSSLLNFHAASSGSGPGYFGGYIDHDGYYGKIKNSVDYKAKAVQSRNSLGIFGKTPLGRRMWLSGDASFDYNVWSRYGYAAVPWASQAFDSDKYPSVMQSYAVPKGRITQGNEFTDLSYFNFQLGLGGYYMQDRFDNSESGFNAFVKFGKAFGLHSFTLRGEYDGAYGGKNLSDHKHEIYTLAPDYRIETGNLKVGAGVDISYSDFSDEDESNGKTYFLPRFDVSLQLAEGGIVPFLQLESSIDDNCYYSLVQRNPYIWPDLDLHRTTREYNFRGGFSGNISSYFSYRLFAGMDMYKDPVYFLTDFRGQEYSSAFGGYSEGKLNAFVAGLALDGKVSGSFMAGIGANYYNYSTDDLEYASGMPKFDANVYVRYNHNDKILLRLGATLLGKRWFGEIDSASMPGTVTFEEYDASLDMSLEAEYRINRGFGVFLNGRNLGNSKVYRFNHYTDQGITVLAGVKLLF